MLYYNMDLFKIIVIIFMIIIIIKVFILDNNNKETFYNSEQSIGGVDDANAINTLAQLARKLMDGGATVPGNMDIQGNMNIKGNIQTSGDMSYIGPSKKNRISLHTPVDGRRALYIAPEKLDGSDWEWGNGFHLEFHDKVINTTSNKIICKGRDILAELDKLNSRWKGDDLTVNSIIANSTVSVYNRGTEGNGLYLFSGSREPAYINFMNHGGGRNGYIQMQPGGRQVNGV